jgi:glycosyltransferase involved in cell wall biosynthesis
MVGEVDRTHGDSARRAGSPMSVVIPAHDEERTIERCVSSLLEGAEPGELEIIVACNGCQDGTVEVASALGPPVTVVVTETASKQAALNLGDEAASAFPRFYLDADIRMTVHGLRTVAAALDRPEVHLAAPGLFVDASRSGWAVRSYYRFYERLPSIEADVAGRGVYAMSRAGREHFDRFPDVTGDDHFIRSFFPPASRVTVPEVTSRVEAPRTWGSLVRRKARIIAGNKEVEALLRVDPGPSRGARGIVTVLREHPARALDLPAYLLVGIAARATHARAVARGREVPWGRDDSRG